MKRIFSFVLTAALVAGLVFLAAPNLAAAQEEENSLIMAEEPEMTISEEGEEASTELSEPDEQTTERESNDPSEETEMTEEETEENLPAEEPGEESSITDPEDNTGTTDPEDEDLPEETEVQASEEDEFIVFEEPAKTGEEDPEETEKIEITSAEIAKKSLVYNGKARTQSGSAVVKALVDGEEKILVRNQDYKIEYKDNVEVGKATMIFTGIGNYTGTIEKTFSIIPASTTIRAITPGTKCFVVKWARQTEQVRGYAIQYGQKSDFSDKKSIYIKENTITSQRISNLLSGKRYYIRIRTFLTVDGVNYYSKWSPVETIALSYNTIKVTGTGAKRTLILMNPKNSVTEARVAVWSKKEGRDDKKWYTMKKDSDGSWKVTVYAAYLKNYGKCIYKCFKGNTQLDMGSFTFSKDDYIASKNSIFVGGSGYTRSVRLVHPSGIKNLRAAVWSKEGGQDDLTWYKMEKQSDGTWFVRISTANLSHPGTCYVHIYANNDEKYIGKTTFSCKLYDTAITWNSSWEFASYSKVHTGTAKLYRATKNRKGIVVGINSGHGTILPAGQDNYVYSHPDHTPKVTGGSTAAGAVWTICDNTGMSFNDGTPEAQVTLQQGLILKDILLNAGYDVIMIRENNDSGLDVIARTVICNVYADCHISLHWDGDGLGYDKGIFYMSVPDALKSMYPTSTIWSESNRLGDSIIKGMQQKGLRIFEGGSMQMDLMQTSYSKVPSIDIELGNQTSSHTTSDLTVRANAMLAGLNIFFGQN